MGMPDGASSGYFFSSRGVRLTFLFKSIHRIPTSRDTIFDGVRARLRKMASSAFLHKSYYPLVGGTSPIPLNKLNAWLRNSYESLYFAVGIFFRNEKRGKPASIKPIDFPLELSSNIVFSDMFLLLLVITFKELVDVVFCSLYLLHIFLNLTIFTVQLFNDWQLNSLFNYFSSINSFILSTTALATACTGFFVFPKTNTSIPISHTHAFLIWLLYHL